MYDRDYTPSLSHIFKIKRFLSLTLGVQTFQKKGYLHSASASAFASYLIIFNAFVISKIIFNEILYFGRTIHCRQN